MINHIVFSKDRPLQLDLLLQSYYKTVKDSAGLKVIYWPTTPSIKSGYALCAKRFPEVQFIEEVRFNETLLAAVDPNNLFTVFFTDDDIFLYEPGIYLSKNAEVILKDEQIVCISLRLHPGIVYCYSGNIPCPCPISNFSGGKFCYNGWPADWPYAMSLDGHIFRTAEILPKLQQQPYNNPNSLEYYLACNPITRPNPAMYCFSKPILINTPINRVQNIFPNRSTRTKIYPVSSPDDEFNTFDKPEESNYIRMNQLYLDGWRVCFDQLKIPEKLNSVHIPLNLPLEYIGVNI